MVLVFGSNHHWISLTIQWRTGSEWSHVGILDLDTMMVIEAKGGTGVTETPLKEFVTRYKRTTFRAVEGSYAQARSHLGKPFDLQGLKGSFWRTFKHCPDSWFCSELVADAMPHIPQEFSHYFTPGTIYRLSFELLQVTHKQIYDHLATPNA